VASKRRKPTHLPEPRGRRGQKAVDVQPGLREWLIDRLQQHVAVVVTDEETGDTTTTYRRATLAELMEELKGTGFAIGRTAVWAFRVAWEKQLAERDLALRQAEEYAALDNDKPLNVEAAVSMMGNIAILNDVRRRLEDNGGIVSPEIQDLLNLASRMQTSAAQRERTKNQIERGVIRAMNRIRGQMEEMLKRKPEAMQIILSTMRDAAKKELAK
jgi:hypothetical protein